MVDSTRVLRLLRSLVGDVAVLRAESGAGRDRRADPLWLRGVKYTFVTAIEACIDIAQHLCSSEGWGPPDDNRDALLLLGTHHVLDVDLAESMGRAVGFRNVLVHEYVAASEDVILARLADPSDLDRFAAAVAALVADHPADPRTT